MYSLDKNEDYSIAATVEEGCIFLHCSVESGSKSSLKLLRDSFEIILQEIFNTGESVVFALTPNERFVKFLGQPYTIVDSYTEHEKEYKVVAWELK